ncbi:glycosyltransferase [Humisphaera borealis]|uniref:Glycosyltransferase n=1 Tax=Humisphaera borealis TaxID=2807512 RepID=A0A7M2WYP9_9BACT|nr:glycosyltransferase [Humisphaera borealis]QOV90647.1 glycosyltransferase [Humisphaera borealis]
MGSKQRIRICHLGKYYPPAPGGIETHVQVLARAQAALGADVHVVCVNHLNNQGREVTWSRRGATQTITEVDQGVQVTRLGRSAHAAKIDFVPDVSLLYRMLRRDSFDIIHLHTPNPTMLLIVAALRPWIPIVITHHSDVVKQRVLYKAFQPFEQLVYNSAARVISNSPTYIAGSSRLLHVANKVETVPMGLKLEPFLNPSPRALAAAAALRAEHGSPLWLAVGRCVYYKGFDTALRALKDVPGKLLLVGQGPYKENLVQAAQKLGVANRLVWSPYVEADDLVGAYHAATAFWFPSNARSEAFGLVQVEAMASGCPVINTAIPDSGVPWVSENEATGLTVPVDNPQAFAAAARRLLENPGLHGRLTSTGRARAIEKFGDAAMAERTIELYDDVFRRRATRSDAKVVRVRSLPKPTPMSTNSESVIDTPAKAKGSGKKLRESYPTEELEVRVAIG